MCGESSVHWRVKRFQPSLFKQQLNVAHLGSSFEKQTEVKDNKNNHHNNVTGFNVSTRSVLRMGNCNKNEEGWLTAQLKRWFPNDIYLDFLKQVLKVFWV